MATVPACSTTAATTVSPFIGSGSPTTVASATAAPPQQALETAAPPPPPVVGPFQQRATEAVFVGEPTAGKPNSYGDSRRITLPNSGVTVRASTSIRLTRNSLTARMNMTKAPVTIPGRRRCRAAVRASCATSMV